MGEVHEKEAELKNFLTNKKYLQLGDSVTTLEGMLYFMENFTAFSEALVKDFAMMVINHWYRDRFNDISEEVNGAAYSFLFETALSIFDSLSDFLKQYYADTMVLFTFLNYPNIIGDLWDTIFGLRSDLLILFLIKFSEETTYLSGARFNILTAFKNTLREQEILNTIVQTVFGLLETQPENATRILSKLCEWCDVSFITDGSVFEALQNCLQVPTAAPYVMDTFLVTMKRFALDEDSLSQLIGAIIDEDILGQLVQTDNMPLHEAIGRVVGFAGNRIISSGGDAQQFFDLATTLLEEKIGTIKGLSPFICNFLERQCTPEFDILPVFELAYNHLVSFFADGDITVSIYQNMESIPKDIRRILLTSWRLKNADCTYFILESIKSFNPIEESPITAAMIYLIKGAIDTNLIISSVNLGEIISSIVPITSIEAPFTQQQLVAFYVFAQLYHVTCDKITEEVAQLAMNVFTQILTTDDVTDKASMKLILQQLAAFTVKRKGSCPLDLARALLETTGNDYISVGASMLNMLEEGRQETIESYVPVFLQRITDAENTEDHRNAVMGALAFLKPQRNIDSEAILGLLMEVQQYVLEDDELLGYFVEAAHNLLPGDFPQMLAEFAENFQGPLSIGTGFRAYYNRLTNVSESFLTFSVATVPNAAVILEVMQALGLANEQADEMVLKMVDVTKNLWNGNQELPELPEETKEILFNIARSNYLREGDSPVLMRASMTILTEFAACGVVEPVLDVVGMAPFAVAFLKNMEPTASEMADIFKRHLALIRKLQIKDRERTNTVLMESADALGISRDDVLKYFDADHMSHQASDPKKEFFQNLLVCMRVAAL